MLNGTMRCWLLSIAVCHHILVYWGWCKLVLIVVEHIVLMLVCKTASVLHLSHSVDSATSSGLQGKYLLLVLQRLRLNVMHAAFWEICWRSQITNTDIGRGGVILRKWSSCFVINNKWWLVCCWSALTVVFLFWTWVIWSCISSLMLRRYVILGTSRSI